MDKYIKHTFHYYADGDIILQVKDTYFLVHKNLLSLASEFFKSLFACATPSSDKIIKVIEDSSKESSIPILEIIDEEPDSIEDILSFIYPNTILYIDWNNVDIFLRLSDKFIIRKLLNSCEVFLLEHFTEKVLGSFILAEKYLLPTIFKESSKLIIDDIIKYECDEDFKLILKRTQERLVISHHIYYLELVKFNKHVREDWYKYLYDDITNEISTFPIPKPSFTRNKIFELSHESPDKEFIKNFKQYLGSFEKLINAPANTDYYYPFIELV
ncbi:BTB/POZ domain-containing protein [Rhizophagus diaphanus]|nr:BTB/POZ domain-containing protein [Rhizophagus diaphanus] [Rhizophagus sp. MUCL 43196]